MNPKQSKSKLKNLISPIDLIYDPSISVNKKRNRIELFDSNEPKEDQETENVEKISKKVLTDQNQFTKRPYSDRYYEILKQRKKLPAWEAKEQLEMLMNEFQVIILQGETGSGKTTQVPQFLLELFHKPGYNVIFFLRN